MGISLKFPLKISKLFPCSKCSGLWWLETRLDIQDCSTYTGAYEAGCNEVYALL